MLKKVESITSHSSPIFALPLPTETPKSLALTSERQIPSQPQVAQTTTAPDSTAWEVLPSTLLSLLSPQKKTKTPVQQELYDYGNVIGEILSSLDTAYGTKQVAIMQHFYQDRSSQSKIQDVLNLSKALSNTGDALSILDVPTSAKTLHVAFAKGYKEIGEKLAAIPTSNTDEQLLDAIASYNNTVESFIQTYTSVVHLFSLNAVHFENTDPGAQFVFSGGAL
jgi:hypothetical protein